jgi:hypothetical protein
MFKLSARVKRQRGGEGTGERPDAVQYCEVRIVRPVVAGRTDTGAFHFSVYEVQPSMTLPVTYEGTFRFSSGKVVVVSFPSLKPSVDGSLVSNSIPGKERFRDYEDYIKEALQFHSGGLEEPGYSFQDILYVFRKPVDYNREYTGWKGLNNRNNWVILQRGSRLREGSLVYFKTGNGEKMGIVVGTGPSRDGSGNGPVVFFGDTVIDAWDAYTKRDQSRLLVLPYGKSIVFAGSLKNPKYVSLDSPVLEVI